MFLSKLGSHEYGKLFKKQRCYPEAELAAAPSIVDPEFEKLRDILDRKQINVVSAMLAQWCTNVMRSKVELMKEVGKRRLTTVVDG